MRKWSRPIGVVASLAVFAALLVVGLRYEGHEVAAPPDSRNGLVFIQDNLWSTETHQYAVWVGTDGTPYAGVRRRDSEEWEIVNLAKLPRNPLAAPTARDEHNVYAIAVDTEGGIHVAGNMHASPLRYVRSAPGSLDRWTTGPGPAEGESVTYPAFSALPDGTLLFWRREGIAGQGTIVLDTLRPGERVWHSLGVVLDGRPSGESPYLHHVAVDPRSGLVHLLFEWRSGQAVETTNDIGYAYSADGGRTWHASNESPLRVPITHASSETVVDTRPTGSGLVNQGGLTVDARGRPHGTVVVDRPGGDRMLEHLWLDRGTWRRERLTGVDVDGRPQLAGTPDGRVWLVGARGGALEAIDVTPGRERLPPREVARVPFGWEATYDSQALARHGAVEILVPQGDRPHVVAARLAGG